MAKPICRVLPIAPSTYHARKADARAGIGRWSDFYNTEPPHSALGGRTPVEAHQGHGLKAAA